MRDCLKIRQQKSLCQHTQAFIIFKLYILNRFAVVLQGQIAPE